MATVVSEQPLSLVSATDDDFELEAANSLWWFKPIFVPRGLTILFWNL